MLKQMTSFGQLSWCLLLGVILICSPARISFAAPSATDLQKGKMLLKQADNLKNKMVADSAYIAYAEAAAIFKNHSPSDYIMARLGQAEMLLNLKATFSCYQQMLEDEVYLKKNLKLSDKAYERFYRLKGELHFSNREVEKALDAWYFARRLTVSKYGKNSLEAAQIYVDLGKCYFAGGRTDSSFAYISRALQILHQQPDPLKVEEAPYIYSLMGAHFRSLQYETMNKSGQEVVYNGKKYRNNTFINLAYQDSAKMAVIKLHGRQAQFLAKIYTQMALANSELFLIATNPAESKLFGSKVIEYGQETVKIYDRYKNPDKAYLLTSLSDMYFNQMFWNEQKAVELQLLALKTCLPNYAGKSLYDIPVIENVQSENHLGIVLENLCYHFLGKYKNTHALRDLETAYEYGLRSLDLAEYIRHRKEIYANASGAPAILFQSWNYGLSIEAAYLLYERTGDEKYKQAAFRKIEKFKNLDLLQAAMNNRLKNSNKTYSTLDADYKRITARMLRKEEQAEIARKFSSLRSISPFSDAKHQLANTHQEMERLAKKTKTAFPEFYRAKIDHTYTLSLKDVQHNLPDNKTAFVSYFLNINLDFNNEAYIMVVQKDRADFIRAALPKDYNGKIDSLVQSITASHLPVYRDMAIQLHDLLMKPAEKVLGKQVEKLMIMPDGFLWKIPFETLLTERVASTDYRKFPYLLKKYHISYQHSATLNNLGHEMVKEQNQTFDEPILAMAPFADKNLAGQIASGKVNLMSGDMTEGTYAKLPYTIDLLQKLQNKIQGLFLIDKDATEESFKVNAGKFSIIHLATHAETDLANPLNSKFLMAKGQKEDGELHMSELLDMDIKPNLAVLSACETGKGRIDFRNEAMTSLSWGFYYLGCPSTLSTLWKVDDRQTSNVLTGFYDYLFAGKTKQEALQQSKLDFIAKARTSDEANPFYWSGLVLTGDAGPMPLPVNPWWLENWFIALVAGVLMLAAWAFITNQKRKVQKKQQFA